MFDPYRELLEATIQHVEGLKARGVRFLDVPAETLKGLQVMSVAPTGARGAAATAPIRSPVTPTPSRTIQAPVRTPSPSAAVAPVATEAPKGSKAEAFAELRQRVLACVKCEPLVAARKNVVFGVGNIDAE